MSLIQSIPEQQQKNLIVALAGNPNSGKTTVFNALTNLRQKVGNYPGVTVEKKLGRLITKDKHAIDILDLPGTYSLAVRSPDEQVARDVLVGHMANTPRPDLVVCIVDATNLERNLYLFTQIRDLGLPIILVLNMMDTVRRQGKTIDIELLSRKLDVPVIPVVAIRGEGIEELKTAIVRGVQVDYRRGWRMPELMEQEIEALAGKLAEKNIAERSIAFSEALIILTREDFCTEELALHDAALIQYVAAVRHRLNDAGINWRSAAIEARYAWIQDVLQDVVSQSSRPRAAVSDRIDAIATHKLWGWLFFFGIMAAMFFMIFSVANYPMDWIDQGFARLSEIVKNTMPAGDLRDLITDGMIAGVGGVLIFLPQILILFFFIGLLQDTGYMARAAFIMDRTMSRVGLHGKSFIPLLSSFACAIPGVMATRSIENPKDRLVTILIAPLMSCSARLPVYTLLIATLIPAASAWEKAGIMLSMYLLGIAGAFMMAFILKRTLFKSQTPVLIMELPPYRWPSLKSVILQMWERSFLFVRRAGTVIFGLSILLWALMSYPQHDNVNTGEALKNSFAGRAGTILEPLIEPLGYDWRIGIGLIGSFAAREVFVSTMNIVFNINEENPDATDTLRDSFLAARWPDGRPLFTPLTCVSLMVFYVFAMQCVSTIAIVRRETNSWRWPLFQLVYMTGLAYLMALLVYQGGKLIGFS